MSKFYAVRVGRVPGIYTSWVECQGQINKYSGSQYKSFTTKEEALRYLNEPTSINRNPKDSICLYVDGGHNKHTGDVAWASVVDGNSKDMLEDYLYLFPDLEHKYVSLPVGDRYILISKFNDVVSQQNNGAELIAMYAALKIAIKTNKYKVIKSDSQLIVEYWSKNLPSKSNIDKRKLEIIKLVIELRKEFESSGGVIEKISGDNNLADLGYHK